MTINQVIDVLISLGLVIFVFFMVLQMRRHRSIINQILAQSLNRDFLLKENQKKMWIQWIIIALATSFALWRFYELLQGFGASGAGFYGLIVLCAGYCSYQAFYYVPLMTLVHSRHLIGAKHD